MLKTLKRKIALVAVVALGAGGLSIVAAPAANAADVTATVTATVSPIRVSFTGANADAVPLGKFSFTLPATLGDGIIDATDTTTALTVLSAPTSSAVVEIDNIGGTSDDVTDSLAITNGETGAKTSAIVTTDLAQGTEVTATIRISANPAPGTYSGRLVITDDGTAADANTITVNWSFTTAGAPKTIEVDKTAVSLASVDDDGTDFVVSQAVVVSLKDANGIGTQIGTGDTLTVAIADNTNIGLVNTAGAASITLSDSDLNDNSHSVVVGSKSTTADSETITITPNGVLPGLGVVAKTLTATSVAYGAVTTVKTKLTSPSATAVVKDNTTTAQSDYSVDPGTSTFIAETSGLEAGKAYRIGIRVTSGGGGNTPAGTYSVAGATAAAWTNGTIHYSYGIADSTGKVQSILVFTTRMDTTTAADKFEINASTANTDFVDATDLLVTASDSAYTTTLTSPATNPSVAVTGSAIAVAGTIADQFGNPFGGATVTVSGAQTLSSGTAAALTGQAITDALGKFSLTLAAANALATKVDLTINASRGGVSAAAKTSTVNLNAGGAATALAWAAVGDEDSAVTPTFYPNIVVPFDNGLVNGITNEGWEIATGAAAQMGAGIGGDNASATLDATDECVAIEVNTTPLAQVTATGSAGVLFSTTACDGTQAVSSLKATATVAAVAVAAGANLWATSTKTGKNTITLTSGAVTKTITFYAQNFLDPTLQGNAARDIVLDSATKTLSGGEIGFVTVTVVDAFGNAVEQDAARSTVKASITGAALLDGPSLSKSGLVGDADGKITLGVIAGNAAGTATLTVTGVNVAGGQFGALAGTATSTTTAGTDTTYKASANVKTATITVAAGSSKTDTEVAAVKADVKAVSDTVATLSKAVTTIQSSVTELTSSFSAQIKSLSSAIAKISRAIAALSKKIK